MRALFPTMLANKGALIRKPLPIMEARGVTVARHEDDWRRRGDKAKKLATQSAIAMMLKFNTVASFYGALRLKRSLSYEK